MGHLTTSDLRNATASSTLLKLGYSCKSLSNPHPQVLTPFYLPGDVKQRQGRTFRRCRQVEWLPLLRTTAGGPRSCTLGFCWFGALFCIFASGILRGRQFLFLTTGERKTGVSHTRHDAQGQRMRSHANGSEIMTAMEASPGAEHA